MQGLQHFKARNFLNYNKQSIVYNKNKHKSKFRPKSLGLYINSIKNTPAPKITTILSTMYNLKYSFFVFCVGLSRRKPVLRNRGISYSQAPYLQHIWMHNVQSRHYDNPYHLSSTLIYILTRLEQSNKSQSRSNSQIQSTSLKIRKHDLSLLWVVFFTRYQDLYRSLKNQKQAHHRSLTYEKQILPYRRPP